jgi:hypothetical protein
MFGGSLGFSFDAAVDPLVEKYVNFVVRLE